MLPMVDALCLPIAAVKTLLSLRSSKGKPVAVYAVGVVFSPHVR